MTSRQALETVAGLTHASKVMPPLSCSDVEFGTLTRALVPLNTSALPYLPAVAHVVAETVPVFPLPDESATDVPVPSSNEYAATSPAVAADPGPGSTTRETSIASTIPSGAARTAPATIGPPRGIPATNLFSITSPCSRAPGHRARAYSSIDPA